MLEALAARLGVVPCAGCTCAVCGPSRYDEGASIPASFSDQVALALPALLTMCAGCTRLLGGRPGDDPPPLRMVSLLMLDDRIETLDRDVMWRALTTPPAERFMLSWARSKKKHHVLYARWSTPAHYQIGCDGETLDYVPARDRVLVDAVLELVSAHTRSAIREGVYHQSTISSFGAARHAALEAVVSVYRRGRPALLDLMLWCAPKEERAPYTEEDPMIHPIDDLAARLLGAVAFGSTYRVEHGIDFWRGFLPHQVERFKSRPLADFVSRLMESLVVEPLRAAEALAVLRGLSAEETAEVETAIRTRTSLVVALSYDHARALKEAR